MNTFAMLLRAKVIFFFQTIKRISFFNVIMSV